MRRILMIGSVLAALALQGCGGLPTKADSTLSSLPLFAANGQPRFTVDLACRGLDSVSVVQCSTVNNAFSDWSGDRGVKLHTVSKNDPIFKTSAMARSHASVPAEPHLVAIRVQPSVVPSMRMSGGGDMGFSGGNYQPGSVGYVAWVRVFSFKTGALVRQVKLRHKQTMPDQTANITPAVKVEVQHLIHAIDPSYAG